MSGQPRVLGAEPGGQVPALSPAPETALPRRRWRRRRSGRAGLIILRYLVLLVIFVISIGPLLWQLSTALKGPAENVFAYPPSLIPSHPTLHNFVAVTQVFPLARYLLNTVIQTVGVTVGNCLFGTMAGYALARMEFRGRRFLLIALVATMVVPFQVVMINEFLVVRDVHLTNTLLGVIIPEACSVLSVFIMRQGYLALPREIEDAARIDGATEWQLFWRVSLPSVRGIMSVVAIFSVMSAWDDFLWPLLVLQNPNKYTLQIGLSYLSGTFSSNERVIAAGSIIAVLPLIAFFLILQRQFFQGIGQGAIKG